MLVLIIIRRFVCLQLKERRFPNVPAKEPNNAVGTRLFCPTLTEFEGCLSCHMWFIDNRKEEITMTQEITISTLLKGKVPCPAVGLKISFLDNEESL